MVAVATSTVLRGSLHSAFNGSGEIVQRGRQSRRVICSVDPVGHLHELDHGACREVASGPTITLAEPLVTLDLAALAR